MEITTTNPLIWIEDKLWERFYKECTLDDMKKARDRKIDISVWNEVLTDYQITRYWEADTIDRFIYFSLPSQPQYIRNKFKTSIANMSREQKRSLTYDGIKIRIDMWKHEEEYYK